MDFKEKLKVVRDESGISLKEIAKNSSIAYDTLRMYSQGRRKPKIEQIQKIAAIPALEPWSELLLEQTELSSDEAEFLVLVGRMKAQGKQAELDRILDEMKRLSGTE
ncbi:helix-turn-helix domain-containing protein [Gynuella sunshinyii]|uniref:Putative transcriptional regulator with an HTH domain n=1 Tax=Gynuella sunshinyii YC6258 TaxID=1445510 RepID=A0A0C5VCM6_9GAMM|nr:helix-turn-helix transcriptional regulator [Gynuella sunshinyii]AJQ92232.1 putative transcriptional regulator with an HTH domain [Gynuella sunshinyii YC6258]